MCLSFYQKKIRVTKQAASRVGQRAVYARLPLGMRMVPRVLIFALHRVFASAFSFAARSVATGVR